MQVAAFYFDAVMPAVVTSRSSSSSKARTFLFRKQGRPQSYARWCAIRNTNNGTYTQDGLSSSSNPSSLHRDRDLDPHRGHLGAQIPKDVGHSDDVHVLALGVMRADPDTPRHIDSNTIALVVFVLVATDSAVFSTRRVPADVSNRLFVAERDERTAFSTDPRCRIVGTVHQTVLKQERRSVRDQSVSLHLSKSDTSGSFSSLSSDLSVRRFLDMS